jgi:prepilin-type N-terminal cleavage/methylation domain-containing protein
MLQKLTVLDEIWPFNLESCAKKVLGVRRCSISSIVSSLQKFHNLPRSYKIISIPDMSIHRTEFGFTLAELLIALTILGVIATFTIPKVLLSQQDTKYKAIAKEAAGALSAAFIAYQQSSTVDANTSLSDLTPYLNYIKVMTSGAVDINYGNTGSNDCATASPCYVLANGAVIRDPYQKTTAGTGVRFGAISATNYIYFDVDPNGTLDDTSTTNGPGKTIDFNLYSNGRIVDSGSCSTGDTTYLGGTGHNDWCPGQSPPWFSWN